MRDTTAPIRSGQGRREARTAASLNHPHIIPIYAVRESQHVLYFVMKYVQGRPLDAILRDVGPLPFPMVRSILADIGSALDYAHRQGVVHRDVKPGNIMIDEEGFAVITDFGIARAIEGGRTASPHAHPPYRRRARMSRSLRAKRAGGEAAKTVASVMPPLPLRDVRLVGHGPITHNS